MRHKKLLIFIFIILISIITISASECSDSQGICAKSYGDELINMRGHIANNSYACDEVSEWCFFRSPDKCEEMNGTCIEYKNSVEGKYNPGYDCGNNEKFICLISTKVNECRNNGGTCVDRYAESPLGYKKVPYDCEMGTHGFCHIKDPDAGIFKKFIYFLQRIFSKK